MSERQQAPASRPVSDVSAGVGLSGLFGLLLWVAVCRNWAAIAEALALPGPRAPMSGPYAALLTLVFSGGPMIAWSLLIDKVHRRRSTGIDWANPRPLAATAEVSITQPLIKQYKANLNAYCLSLKDYITRRGGTYLFTSTAVPFDTLVLNYLRERGLLG